MNERQLPGLSLDLPCGSSQSSAERRSRALLRLQWRHKHSGAEWCDGASGDRASSGDTSRTGDAAVHTGGTSIYATTSAASANAHRGDASHSTPARRTRAGDCHRDAAVAQRRDARVQFTASDGTIYAAAPRAKRFGTVGTTLCARWTVGTTRRTATGSDYIGFAGGERTVTCSITATASADDAPRCITGCRRCWGTAPG